MATSEDLQAEYAEAWANLEEAKLKLVEVSRQIGPEQVEDLQLSGRAVGS